MTECVFEIHPDNPARVRCVRGGCGREMWYEPGQPLEKYHATCTGTGPGMLEKAKNFAKAAAEHVATGMKTVTDEVAARRADICRGCELFVIVDGGGYCSHKSCGCQTTNMETFVAKQRWEESKCPSPKGDKWRMTDEQLAACGHPDKPKETT